LPASPFYLVQVTGEENEGTILYIKSSLTGCYDAQDPKNPTGSGITIQAEPVDILNYKREHAAFPHDTTLNQWFTESQFESYRRLGQHLADEIKQCGQRQAFS